ncbi:hypothetical protein KPL78_27060 [Roseomonas sp. HJA6]|uniref:Integrase SAM-like N-terminal domain-containing protein n=1 Tax=Roseomonas alba TaxID=2846776 RepID=A0ABS7AGV2_9PROT|nr:hypothetical protein [Neoroseomonas alba]
MGAQWSATSGPAAAPARVLLGRIAQGDNPAEQRELDHRAITVKELCERYLGDAKASLILGKTQRPKKASTIYTDEGRIKRHIVPLLGTWRVKDLTIPASCQSERRSKPGSACGPRSIATSARPRRRSLRRCARSPSITERSTRLCRPTNRSRASRNRPSEAEK